MWKMNMNNKIKKIIWFRISHSRGRNRFQPILNWISIFFFVMQHCRQIKPIWYSHYLLHYHSVYSLKLNLWFLLFLFFWNYFFFFSIDLIERLIYILVELTNNIQSNWKTFNWYRWNLTFIHSGITFLCPFDLHCPFVELLMKCCCKPLIVCIGISANS